MTAVLLEAVSPTTVVSTKLSKGSDSQMRMVVAVNTINLEYDGIDVGCFVSCCV